MVGGRGCVFRDREDAQEGVDVDGGRLGVDAEFGFWVLGFGVGGLQFGVKFEG